MLTHVKKLEKQHKNKAIYVKNNNETWEGGGEYPRDECRRVG
jgi:hypothetical protein